MNGVTKKYLSSLVIYIYGDIKKKYIKSVKLPVNFKLAQSKLFFRLSVNVAIKSQVLSYLFRQRSISVCQPE